MARIRSKEELFRHRFVNRHLNHWSSNFFLEDRLKKNIYIYILHLYIEKLYLYDYGSQIIYHKRKKRGEKGSRNIAELNFFSPRG